MKNPQIIEELYNKYVDRMYSYAIGFGCDKITVMDIIHDVFYKLCIQEHKLDKIDNYESYLFRSLRNQIIDLYRVRKDNISFEEAIADIDYEFNINVSVEDEYIDMDERRILNRKIQMILNNLNSHQREIIYLRYVHGYSYDEISQILGINVSSCRKLLNRTLTKLKKNNTFFLLLALLDEIKMSLLISQ